MKGPDKGTPQLVTNFADFRRKYGGYLSQEEFGDYRFLAYAVEHFFINGGTRAYIMRVTPPDAKCAHSVSEQSILKFTAKDAGKWGIFIRVVITPSSKAKTQILSAEELVQGMGYKVKNAAGFQTGDIVAFSDGNSIQYNKISSVQDNLLSFTSAFDGDVTDTEILPSKVIYTCEFNVEVKYEDAVEMYENVSLNLRSAGFIKNKMAKSALLDVSVEIPETDTLCSTFEMIAGADKDILVIGMDGGSNDTKDALSAADFIGTDNGPGKRTGIQSFIANDVMSIIAVPGVTDPNVQLSLVAHFESLASRFAVLDLPRESQKIDDVVAHRNIFDSSYAALYHPWIEVFDPLSKMKTAIPPSGSIAGIFARSDTSRGVHKAPANEIIRACVGLDCMYNKGEQDILNPKGVNLIRAFPGQGIRVWGARTLSFDPSWKYVNIRRLFIYLEESIKGNTNWVVFEPND